MNQIGLDIGDSLVKAVEIQKDKNKSELVTVAKASFNDFKLLSDSESNKKKAVEFITDFVMQNKLLGKPVNVSIPQSTIFTKISSFPSDLKKKDLENAINLEIEQESPIPLDEASKNFQLLPKSSSSSDKNDVLIVIAPLSLTQKTLDIVKPTGLKVLSIEPTFLANIRGVIDEEADNTPTIIVDIGNSHTDILIYSDSALRFTRSISTGFSSIVKAVSQELDLEPVQAEEYVKTYGLLNDKLSGKIKNAITPIYSIVLNEIKRSVTFFESRNSSNIIKRTILTGGGALIPGIVVSSANFLDTEVQLANPWNRIISLGEYKDRQNEIEDTGPIYTTAVGLSLKNLV